MTVSDKQARNALPPARMLRSKAVVDAKSAGALPNLIGLTDTVMEIRAIKPTFASGIHTQKSIEP